MEHGVRRAADGDGDGHREPARQGEGAIPDQHADRETRVERQRVEPAQPARVASGFLELFDAAERDACEPPRFTWRDSALAHEAFRFHVDMEAHLVAHRGVELARTPERPPHGPHSC